MLLNPPSPIEALRPPICPTKPLNLINQIKSAEIFLFKTNSCLSFLHTFFMFAHFEFWVSLFESARFFASSPSFSRELVPAQQVVFLEETIFELQLLMICPEWTEISQLCIRIMWDLIWPAKRFGKGIWWCPQVLLLTEAQPAWPSEDVPAGGDLRSWPVGVFGFWWNCSAILLPVLRIRI